MNVNIALRAALYKHFPHILEERLEEERKERELKAKVDKAYKDLFQLISEYKEEEALVIFEKFCIDHMDKLSAGTFRDMRES